MPERAASQAARPCAGSGFGLLVLLHPPLRDRATSHEKIEMVWDSVPLEVQGDAGGVNGIKVRNSRTNTESVLPVKGVFIAIGHVPNTKALRLT